MHSIDYFFQSLKLITSPKLRRYLYWPIILNAILLVLIGYIGIHGIESFGHWLNHFLPSWLGFLDWLAVAVFSLALIALLIYSFTTLATLVGAPFYSLLCQKILLQRGHRIEDESLADTVKDTPRLVGRELSKLRYSLSRTIVLLLLMLIPGINLITSLLWFTFNIWQQALQYLDYPMDLYKHPFKDTRRLAQRHPLNTTGFGLIAFVCSLIPLLNLIAIPTAVGAATLLWSDKMSSELE